MFSEDQHTASLRWLYKAVQAQSKEQIENIKKVIDDPARSKNVLLWILWASDQFDPVQRAHAEELLYRYPQMIPNDFIFDQAILSMMKERLNAGLEEGVECEICNQFAKEYKRAFNANQAVFMRSLVVQSVKDIKNGGDGWIHHSDLKYTGRDYTMVAHWGLAQTNRMERDEDGKKKKKTTGMWKPTEEGISFVKGSNKVRSHIFMYNGSCREDTEAPFVSIYDALGKTFVFSDLFDQTEKE